MKRIWAPWRLEYILDHKDEECFLCRILDESDDRGNCLLKRGEKCAVVLNIYPYNNGHLMVFPCRHISDVTDMTEEERAETMALVSESLRVLRSEMRPDGFNIGINLGRAAGAGLEEHVHTHVVPRWNGDSNFMPVLGETKVIPQALRELRDQLHPAFNA
jgi:ATP adenylyltransferase